MLAIRRISLSVLLVFATGLPATLSASELSPSKSVTCLSPAEKWEDGMVTGNGLIGTLHYGGPLDEAMVFNCHKFVVPNGAPFPVPDLTEFVEPMRDLMLAGKIGDGWRLYHDAMLRGRGLEVKRENYYGMVYTQGFHAGYRMNVVLDSAGEVRNYRRYTNYQTGEVVTRWTDDRGDWCRKSFASRADEILVSELIAPAGKTIDCRLKVTQLPRSKGRIEPTLTVDQKMINFRGKYSRDNPNQAGFEGVTRVIADGGQRSVIEDENDKQLAVTGAGKLLLLTKLDRYRTDCSQWEAKPLQTALAQENRSYDELLARHVAVHQPIFDRVELTLGGKPEDQSLDSETLIAREEADTKTIDQALLEKVFYTSRYLFMASSGTTHGPRLSGMFSGSWGAAWAGDYTCDSNVNLAVFGGNIADLPECMEGYFKILERSQPQWEEAAKQLYGCRGILGPIRIDGEVAVPIHCGPYHAHCCTTGLGPWLMYPMYEHYQITGDKEFLRNRLYPLLLKQADFYEDFLARTDDNGDVIFVPSNSPENAWGGIKPRTSAAINSTMDIAACKHALTMLLQTEQQLGISESENTAKWQALIAKLPPYLINDEGALKEWSWPTIGENYGHRHSSHMYPVNTSYEINLDNPATSHLVPAVETALNKRKHKLVQAHDVLQKAVAWIRVKRGDEIHRLVKHLMENKYLYNGLQTSHNSDHHIYNYDSILCLQGLLIEMCVFTNQDANQNLVELLPALPADFKTGTIRGVKGRNRTTINQLTWDTPAGKITGTITSDVDQTITLMHRAGIKSLKTEAEVSDSQLGPHAKQVQLKAGEAVEFVMSFQD